MLEFSDEEWKLYGEMLEKDPIILKNVWGNAKICLILTKGN